MVEKVSNESLEMWVCSVATVTLLDVVCPYYTWDWRKTGRY